MPRTQKIQIGVIVALIGLILTLATNLIAYVRSDQSLREDVKQHGKEIERMRPKVEDIGSIKTDITNIKRATERIEEKLDEFIKEN